MDIKHGPLCSTFGKKPEELTVDDVVSYFLERDAEIVNFMYPASDGRLKTLNFAVNDEDYLREILTEGERVDGSSLFPFIEAGSSDIYVIPRIGTAFVDPFSEGVAVCFLCAFCDKDGKRLELSPEYTLQKASEAFRRETGMEFHAMGELEYYVCATDDDGQLSAFPATDQKGYHESGPFAKFNDFRVECMRMIMGCGGKIKYGHSEVGNFRLGDVVYEQNEIEFLPVPVIEAADTLMIAKWVIRNLAYRRGLDVSFAPKITEGKAGSGLHVHLKIVKDGVNLMTVKDGGLSDIALKAIAGMLKLAPSITAFGNGNPVSYLRLVPHQEAPTRVCWGMRNRSALVRVPLGWSGGKNMSELVNGSPAVGSVVERTDGGRQTVEIRSSDCSADIYLLMAAICTACRHGLSMPDALAFAESTFVDRNIHAGGEDTFASLENLPASCDESADALLRQREVYESYGVFSPQVVEARISTLKSFGDADLRNELKQNPGLMAELVRRYYYCG
ncbi:MAG: glutamine synthetase family protein [Candidatus Cryptobacteroides sp.]